MLEVYEGTLGGGKSYHAVKRALAYLASGGRVYSNIELKEDACRAYVSDKWGLELSWSEQYHYLSAQDIARLHEVVKGGTSDCNVLCILDEIHLYHNARDWAQASRGLLQWLTQSRKLYVDIICITQHRNNLDKQWIRLVGKYWRFRDLRKWRMPGLGLRIPFFQALAVELDQDGRTVINKQFERFEPSVFTCYSSEQLFDGVAEGFAGSGLSRLKLKKSQSKWRKRMKVILWVVVMVAGIVVACWYGCKSRSHSLFRPSSVPAEVERPPSRRVRVRDESTDVPVAPLSPWVECPGWYARDGKVVGGYSTSARLTFLGEPDGLTNGLPYYARARGMPF